MCGRDPSDGATLAAVGIDIMATGHMKYTSVPAFRSTPLIGCTSRAALLEWLASLGAVTDFGSDDGSAAAAAESTPIEAMAPRWAGWREEPGARFDGTLTSTFFLIDAVDRSETPAVHGVEHAATRNWTFATLVPRPGMPIGTALGGRSGVLDFLKAS